MTTLKKTIQINPELFKMNQKTKNNRSRRVNTGQNSPIIKPNSLKKHLINRIKEHKLGEKKGNGVGSGISSSSDNNSNQFTDELYDSFQYLSSLSKKHKEDNEQKKREQANKTLKHPLISTNAVIPSYSYQNISTPFVNLELPEELQETFTPILLEPSNIVLTNGNTGNTSTSSSIKDNQDIPYGCLKGGVKPTYRAWSATRKRMDPITSFQQTQFETHFEPSVRIPTEILTNMNDKGDREHKLELLKIKMKKQEELQRVEQLLQEEEQRKKNLLEPDLNMAAPPIDTSILNRNVAVSNELFETIEKNKKIPDKKFIKRTISKKYTLGKSKINNSVGVLLKDNRTRKNVLNAQKELKRVAINDVKNYLKTHGLIKSGSVAPNDVLRKTYESAMLAGEIVNYNKDTLLHNFLHDTQQ